MSVLPRAGAKAGAHSDGYWLTRRAFDGIIIGFPNLIL